MNCLLMYFRMQQIALEHLEIFEIFQGKILLEPYQKITFSACLNKDIYSCRT